MNFLLPAPRCSTGTLKVFFVPVDGYGWMRYSVRFRIQSSGSWASA